MNEAFVTAFSWVMGAGLAMLVVIILLIALGKFLLWTKEER